MGIAAGVTMAGTKMDRVASKCFDRDFQAHLHPLIVTTKNVWFGF